jgi:hypothetical protein
MGNRIAVVAASAGDRLLDAGVALVLVGGLVLPVVTASAQTGDPVLLNEMLLSHTGDDTAEYVELYGTPGHSLDGLSLVVVDGDNSLAGTIDLRVDFGPDDRLGGNGFFLVGNPVGLVAHYGVSPDVAVTTTDVNGFMRNGSQTVGLLPTAGLGALGTKVTGSETVLDSLGLRDGGFTEMFFWGAPVLEPDDGFLAAGARRLTDGDDTDSPDDWAVADDLLGPANTPTPASPFDEAPTATCGPMLTTTSGTAASAPVSATDPDGVVTAFSLTVTPDPGTISLSDAAPAGGVGGTGTASVLVGAGTPAGTYAVEVTASTAASPPQRAACVVSVQVEAAPEPPPDDPAPPSVAELMAMLDTVVADGGLDPRRANALRGHLERAQRLAETGQDAAALAQLQAFANQANGFAPKWMTAETAAALAAVAAPLMERLGG